MRIKSGMRVERRGKEELDPVSRGGRRERRRGLYVPWKCRGGRAGRAAPVRRGNWSWRCIGAVAPVARRPWH